MSLNAKSSPQRRFRGKRVYAAKTLRREGAPPHVVDAQTGGGEANALSVETDGRTVTRINQVDLHQSVFLPVDARPLGTHHLSERAVSLAQALLRPNTSTKKGLIRWD